MIINYLHTLSMVLMPLTCHNQLYPRMQPPGLHVNTETKQLSGSGRSRQASHCTQAGLAFEKCFFDESDAESSVGGGFWMVISSTFIGGKRAKGACPCASSRMVMPNDQMSASELYLQRVFTGHALCKLPYGQGYWVLIQPLSLTHCAQLPRLHSARPCLLRHSCGGNAYLHVCCGLALRRPHSGRPSELAQPAASRSHEPRSSSRESAACQQGTPIIWHSCQKTTADACRRMQLKLLDPIAFQPSPGRAAHPVVCSITSGAIQQGVPTNVLRARFCAPHDPPRSMVAATPKSASITCPLASIRMLPACAPHAARHCRPAHPCRRGDSAVPSNAARPSRRSRLQLSARRGTG